VSPVQKIKSSELSYFGLGLLVYPCCSPSFVSIPIHAKESDFCSWLLFSLWQAPSWLVRSSGSVDPTPYGDSSPSLSALLVLKLWSVS
jgi:hypothetical protein